MVGPGGEGAKGRVPAGVEVLPGRPEGRREPRGVMWPHLCTRAWGRSREDVG